MEIFRLFGSIFVKDEASKELDNIDKKGNGLSKSFTSLGKVIIAAFAIDKIIDFGKQMIETTAKIQALDSQFTQAFKENGTKAMELINKQSKEQGINVDRLKGTWSSFYGTFRGNGADANQSLDLTNKYMNLAADGAAYYDLSLEDVSSRLKSLVMGNFEAGDAIGVNINATKMDIKAKEKYGKAWKDLTDTQKEFLLVDTVGKIYENSGAMGQGSREANNWSNVTENLKATWQRFLSIIGSPVLKVATKVVQGLTGVIEQLTARVQTFNIGDFVSGLKIPTPLIDNVMYFAEIIKGLAIEFAKVAKIDLKWIFEGLKNVFEALSPIIETFSNVFVNILGTGLVIVFDVLTKVWDVLNLGIQLFLDIVSVILQNVSPAFDSIGGTISEFAGIILDVWNNTIKPFIDEFIVMIYDLWATNSDKINLIGELFRIVFDKIAQNVQFLISIFKAVFLPVITMIVDFWRSHWDQVRAIFQSVINIIAGILNFIIGILTGDWNRALEAVKSIATNALNVVKNAFSIAVDWIKTVWAKLKDILSSPIESAKEAIMGIVEKIKSAFGKIFPINIKMPHFKVSGSLNPSDWLKGGGMPKVGVEWYAEGGILTQPTVFGMNGNNAMVGGEAGAEAILPIEKLSSILADTLKQMNTDRPILIQIDGKTIVRCIADDMGEELASKQKNNIMGLGGAW